MFDVGRSMFILMRIGCRRGHGARPADSVIGTEADPTSEFQDQLKLILKPDTKFLEQSVENEISLTANFHFAAISLSMLTS